MIGNIRNLAFSVPLVTFCVLAPIQLQAQVQTTEQTSTSYIKPAGSQKITYGAADRFTGRVQVTPLFQADDDIKASAAFVTFEQGARTAWHSHPAGQRLVVISGIGLTQIEGQPVQIIREGDVVICPPGVKHWHGAAPNSSMTHLAITTPIDGKSADWLEKVSDEQYNAP